MPKVTYITPVGSKIVVENAQGTLMEAATEYGVDGIFGDCGGVCSCGTCHVRVAPEWKERLEPMGDDERELLGYHEQSDDRSRLSCQITLTDELDGLVVEVAPFEG